MLLLQSCTIHSFLVHNKVKQLSNANGHSLKPLPGPTVPVNEGDACPASSLYIGLYHWQGRWDVNSEHGAC